MVKFLELSDPTSCINKAASDEPVFVLRAKDPVAAMIVRKWAAYSEGIHEPEKNTEALRLADQMDAWRNSKNDEELRRVPTPAIYPATLVGHTVSGPEPLCDRHAVALAGLMSALSADITFTPTEPGAECRNCRNEAHKQRL